MLSLFFHFTILIKQFDEQDGSLAVKVYKLLALSVEKEDHLRLLVVAYLNLLLVQVDGDVAAVLSTFNIGFRLDDATWP